MSRHGRVLFCLLTAICMSGYGPTSQAADRVENVTADGGSVIPDCDGRIDEVMLFFDPELAEELDPFYRDLFTALGPDVRLRVICPTPGDGIEFAHRWGELAAIGEREVEVVSVGMPVSIWSRDRLIARQSRSLLRRSNQFVTADNGVYSGEKRNDRVVHGLLSLAGLAPGLYSTSLHLEGGNVVSNRRHVFVGANVIDENPELAEDRRLNHELRRVLGRPYVMVGEPMGQVPWCHIDMYLTPLDDRTLMVASPVMGRQMLKKLIEAGDESAAVRLDSLADSEDVDVLFDDAARRMEHLGYAVIRVPALVNLHEDWMVTYNNVLMERRGNERFAYVPQYGIPELDAAGIAAYADAGFVTRGVDVSRVYEYGGALRCIANVTERTPARSVTRRAASGKAHQKPTGLNFVNLASSILIDDYECDEQDASTGAVIDLRWEEMVPSR
jgi:hypothetical protein